MAADDGALPSREELLAAGRGRRLQPKGALSSEAAVEVVAIDDEGNAVARPVGWQGEGPPPRIVLASAAGRRPLPAPGIGERAIARLRPLPGGW